MLSGKGEAPRSNCADSSWALLAVDVSLGETLEPESPEDPQETTKVKNAAAERLIIRWGKIAIIEKQLQNCLDPALQAQFVKEGLCLHIEV